MQPSCLELPMALPLILVRVLVSINVSSVLVKPPQLAKRPTLLKLVTMLKMLVSFKFDLSTKETLWSTSTTLAVLQRPLANSNVRVILPQAITSTTSAAQLECTIASSSHQNVLSVPNSEKQAMLTLCFLVIPPQRSTSTLAKLHVILQLCFRTQPRLQVSLISSLLTTGTKHINKRFTV